MLAQRNTNLEEESASIDKITERIVNYIQENFNPKYKKRTIEI